MAAYNRVTGRFYDGKILDQNDLNAAFDDLRRKLIAAGGTIVVPGTTPGTTPSPSSTYVTDDSGGQLLDGDGGAVMDGSGTSSAGGSTGSQPNYFTDDSGNWVSDDAGNPLVNG